MSEMKFGSFGYIVDSCPGNKTEYTDSATRLGCGVDENGRSQYVCVPNHQRSSLVEFCYKSTVGFYEKGNCIEVYENGNLDQTSCQHFTHGCPSKHFFLSDLYNFSACHEINTKGRCFNADPFCPKIAFSTEPPTTEKNLNGRTLTTGGVVGISVGMFVAIVAAVLVIFILRKLNKGSEKENDIEEQLKMIPRDDECGKIETEERTEKNIEEQTKMIGKDGKMETEERTDSAPKSPFNTGDYEIWKTSLSDKFSTLSDDEVLMLFCFLCSDSGPPDFTDTEWLDMLNEIREEVYCKEKIVTIEEAQQTLDRLKSRDYLWEDLDKINENTKDEIMYRIVSINGYTPFYYSSYNTASMYLRSNKYKRKPREKCVISNLGIKNFDELMILRLQMNILTHVTMEDTDIYDTLVHFLNTPDHQIRGNQSERKQLIKNLKGNGEVVRYRGGSGDSVEHVRWLWRCQYDGRPDIVRSCIGLHPHWDIYIIDNKAYRKPSEYIEYSADNRSVLYSLLLCDNYTATVNEEAFKSILIKIRESGSPGRNTEVGPRGKRAVCGVR